MTNPHTRNVASAVVALVSATGGYFANTALHPTHHAAPFPSSSSAPAAPSVDTFAELLRTLLDAQQSSPQASSSTSPHFLLVLSSLIPLFLSLFSFLRLHLCPTRAANPPSIPTPTPSPPHPSSSAPPTPLPDPIQQALLTFTHLPSDPTERFNLAARLHISHRDISSWEQQWAYHYNALQHLATSPTASALASSAPLPALSATLSSPPTPPRRQRRHKHPDAQTPPAIRRTPSQRSNRSSRSLTPLPSPLRPIGQ